MCGIAGFWGRQAGSEQLGHIAETMAAKIVHRGPDSAGNWVDAESGIGLAHRRLSILDLSSAGHQPMHSASNRYVVSFNGEIYNHLNLRTQLEKAGLSISWRGTSDTETLLACLESLGLKKTLSAINGMFAIAVWDKQERTLYLCRDRVGEKPLYYGWSGDCFLFASELSALKAHPAFNQRICRKALALLLRYNYVPAPFSIYEGVFKLMPGHYLELKDRSESQSSQAFWSLSDVSQHASKRCDSGLSSGLLSEEEVVNQFEDVLGRAVSQQCLSDVPIGALLSGGIDSTLICALMQSSLSAPINTFTVGFDETAYNEAHHAHLIARHLGTNHTEMIFSGRDCLELVPKLPAIYDEPFADSSQLPTALVMQMAASQVSVALSGDGADELFAGYTRYQQVPRVWSRIAHIPEPMRRALSYLMTLFSANRLNAGYSGSSSFSQFGDKLHRLGQRMDGLTSGEDLYMALVSEWRDGIPVLDSGLGVEETGLLADFSDIPLHNLSESMMLMDALTYLPDDILVKVDRAAMHVSLETRAPYLDPGVIEFAWSLGLRHKMDSSRGKKIMRSLLRRYVPESMFDRPKQGFAIPLNDWLRGPLKEWASSLLEQQRLVDEGFFDAVAVQRVWQDHQLGKGNYGYRIWSVLMFQSWMENQ